MHRSIFIVILLGLAAPSCAARRQGPASPPTSRRDADPKQELLAHLKSAGSALAASKATHVEVTSLREMVGAKLVRLEQYGEWSEPGCPCKSKPLEAVELYLVPPSTKGKPGVPVQIKTPALETSPCAMEVTAEGFVMPGTIGDAVLVNVTAQSGDCESTGFNSNHSLREANLFIRTPSGALTEPLTFLSGQKRIIQDCSSDPEISWDLKDELPARLIVETRVDETCEGPGSDPDRAEPEITSESYIYRKGTWEREDGR